MLSRYISKTVLTIGCLYDPPKGGVAQVIYTYSEEVFPIFKFIANSGNGNKLGNLFLAVWALFQMVYRLLVDKNIKIVHIHSASYNSFKRSSYFVKVAKLLKKKVVLHIHGGAFQDYYLTNPQWIKMILSSSDIVLALTNKWKYYFENSIGLDNVYVVNNIIKSPTIRDSYQKDGKFHLLFLGLINESKGVFDLLKVIKEYKFEWEDKLILHIGGNGQVDELLQYIHENHLDRIIKYEGWVSGEKKIELLNLMDVFILPSYAEGLPISILEAFSYGKPVIATTVGGIPEVVNDQNGFLFTAGDLKALAKIIGSLLDNSMLVQDKSIKAKLSVDKNFPYNITAELDNLYRGLLSS